MIVEWRVTSCHEVFLTVNRSEILQGFELVVEFDGVCAVTLEVKKFILPDCDSVSDVITRVR